jgi:nicotinamide mononucleotide (NMN) deamidase PncC
VQSRRILFAGTRHEIRARAAQAALMLLHRHLVLGTPVSVPGN